MTTHYDGSMDKWSLYDGVSLPPTVKNFKLTEDNKVRVVQWRDLREVTGSEIYMAYVVAPGIDWVVEKVCTVPKL